MTEEIIIDWVNVAGCDFYNDCRCSAQEHYAEGEFLWAEKCEECPNCYYKQLNRLEQENEALRNQCNKCKQYAIEQNNRRLLDENEKLKEEFEKTSDGFLKIQYKLASNCDNYRKALEEIRELAEKSIKISYNLEVNSMLYDIKDKINECIGG